MFRRVVMQMVRFCDKIVVSDYTGPLKAFCARFSITTNTTGIRAMSTERETCSGSQIPGIRNGFRYFLATSQRVLKRLSP